jgi:hypothetical protein
MTVYSLFVKAFLRISVHLSIDRCYSGDLYLRNGSLKGEVVVVRKRETREMAVKSSVTFDRPNNISSSGVG